MITTDYAYKISLDMCLIDLVKYDNPIDNKAIIEVMNEGAVLVLFGSISMLGAGASAQKRAIAIHYAYTSWGKSMAISIIQSRD